MLAMIVLANGGGISGAGSIIPIILIFFDMSMKKAVPLSAILAVVSSLNRFLLNFNQKHPNNKERLSLNYEVATLVMPSVYFCSIIGVQIGLLISVTTQQVVFAIVVCWSIYTSGKKARELYLKEKQKALAPKVNQNTPLLSAEKPDEMESESEEQGERSSELKGVIYEELHHFTLKRCVYLTICFLALFFASYNIGKQSKLGDKARMVVFVVFGIYSFMITAWVVRDLVKTHKIKVEHRYKFDPSDFNFSQPKHVAKISFVCGLGAILCGMTGIAGGMVIGPIFLSYKMIPIVMSMTNQYITLIASLSVVIQFFMEGLLSLDYAIVFAFVAFTGSLIGITAVNKAVQKSGKQSPIAIMLTLVLIQALILLPVNAWIKSKRV